MASRHTWVAGRTRNSRCRIRCNSCNDNWRGSQNFWLPFPLTGAPIGKRFLGGRGIILKDFKHLAQRFIVPNLGVVKYRDYRSFIIADIPGIIEGAHEGKGLGHRFLKHIERNAVLLLLIPADSEDHRKEYETLVNELTEFNKELAMKDRIVAISKCEMLDDELKDEIKKEMEGVEIHFFSSVAKQGLVELKDILWNALESNSEV